MVFSEHASDLTVSRKQPIKESWQSDKKIFFFVLVGNQKLDYIFSWLSSQIFLWIPYCYIEEESFKDEILLKFCSFSTFSSFYLLSSDIKLSNEVATSMRGCGFSFVTKSGNGVKHMYQTLDLFETFTNKCISEIKRLHQQLSRRERQNEALVKKCAFLQQHTSYLSSSILDMSGIEEQDLADDDDIVFDE